MNEKQYNKMVGQCVLGLRILMIFIAALIPVILTVDTSILNRIVEKRLYSPCAYYIYELLYGEFILSYVLCLFLNFKERVIFSEENAMYLKKVGKLIIWKDFIYIPYNMILNEEFTIKFNIMAWLIGYIVILLSNVFLRRPYSATRPEEINRYEGGC